MDQTSQFLPASVPGAISFNDRWDLLRTEIEQLWLDQRVKLKDLVEIMKEQHGFDASETQYKYRFKQWGIKRSLTKEKKEKIINNIGQKRVSRAKSSTITQYGRPIDSRNIRRHAKQLVRNASNLRFQKPSLNDGIQILSGQSLPFGNRIFLGWNMPYAAMVTNLSVAVGHPSPFGPSASTPSDIVINTPPTIAPSPRDAPSPLSTAIIKTTTVQRSRLFVEGKHLELIQSLNIAERKIMSTWLYQFWLFSFKTAKHWGRGPRNWNAERLGFLDYLPQSSAASPAYNGASPAFNGTSPPDVDMYVASPGGDIYVNLDRNRRPPMPTQLCRWAIHVLQEDYEAVESPRSGLEPDAEVGNDTEWPSSWTEPSFEERLRNNLESNDFSNIDAQKLPVAVPQIVAAASQSPDEMLEEAVGFAIVARNTDLLATLLIKVNNRKLNISGLHPYHLAATYLDGSRSCCMALILLMTKLRKQEQNRIRNAYINDLGHTVLDNLLITILRSHTSIRPGMVDQAWRKDNQFFGDQVDICGRWEPDSECYQELTRKGHVTVPNTWKHKFCHTSVQAITHCIAEISVYSYIFERHSGLFQRLCAGCGLRMQLRPLHALVVVTYYLATSGFDGEDLFGAICCLFIMLHAPLDPRETVDVSILEILGIESEQTCSHTDLSPATLAQLLSEHMEHSLAEEVAVGWSVFSHVLGLAEIAWHDFDKLSDDFEWPDERIQGYEERCHEACLDSGHIFQQSSILGHVWAALQADLITYRRQREGDSWMSSNFDMRSVLQYILNEDTLDIPFIADNMIRGYCCCGRFGEERSCRREDVEAFYFSNLDDWARTTIIDDRLRYDGW